MERFRLLDKLRGRCRDFLYSSCSLHIFSPLSAFLHSGGLPGDSVVKNPLGRRRCGSVLESERYPGERNGYPLQYTCLEFPWTERAWWTTVHRVAKESDWVEWLNNKQSENAHQVMRVNFNIGHAIIT